MDYFICSASGMSIAISQTACNYFCVKLRAATPLTLCFYVIIDARLTSVALTVVRDVE